MVGMRIHTHRVDRLSNGTPRHCVCNKCLCSTRYFTPSREALLRAFTYALVIMQYVPVQLEVLLCCFLRPQGKKWIEDVRSCLMKAIVNSDVFAAPNNFTKPCEDIATLAFDSHPKCYTQHGFCDVIVNKDHCKNLKGIFEVIEFEDFGFKKYALHALEQVRERVIVQ